MVTANELFFDMQVRHSVYLQQYGNHVLAKVNKLLNASEQALEEKLYYNLPKLNNLKSESDWSRMVKLLDEIKDLRSVVWGATKTVFEDELVSLALSEPESYLQMLEVAVPVVITTTLPQSGMLRAIATSRPFQGKVMKDWARKMELDDISRIHQSVQIGMTLGETTPNIIKRVLGSKGVMGTDGITQMTRNQVESVVRTAIQHVSNSAKEAFLNENQDITDEDIYISVLDSRTTPGCRALDHKRFKRNIGPKPPLHFRCRGIRLAFLDGVLLGDRPAKPVTEKLLLKEYAKENNLGSIAKRSELPYGTKTKYDEWSRGKIRELVGPVPASTHYGNWLGKQSIDFQEEVLGKAKAKLFRDGGLPIERFVDKQYQPLTLKELAMREAEAFRRAGLDPKTF